MQFLLPYQVFPFLHCPMLVRVISSWVICSCFIIWTPSVQSICMSPVHNTLVKVQWMFVEVIQKMMVDFSRKPKKWLWRQSIISKHIRLWDIDPMVSNFTSKVKSLCMEKVHQLSLTICKSTWLLFVLLGTHVFHGMVVSNQNPCSICALYNTISSFYYSKYPEGKYQAQLWSGFEYFLVLDRDV